MDLSGSEVGGGKRYVRVRVGIEVNKPLITGFPLARGELPVLWIPFKYEKLGGFCYGCGILGHNVNNCQDEESQRLWKDGATLGIHGNWLKSEVSEFQPVIDLESLHRSNIVESNLNRVILPNNREITPCPPSTSPTQVSLQARIQFQQQEPMDLSESWVADSLIGGGGKLEATTVETQAVVAGVPSYQATKCFQSLHLVIDDVNHDVEDSSPVLNNRI